MKTNHKYFSNLAFNLAENHLGKTSTNPSVGCVIVKNNTVISTGVTSITGRPHAEFNALNKKINFNGANMYVTLEPCTHYGLTPPCTDIIKYKKIKNVFYNYKDPDERTSGKAKKELFKNNIKLKRIKNIKKNFYKSYFINKYKNLPLVDAKIAISNDFNTINKTSKRITNNRSRNVSHLLRSKYDCILSTSKTINCDNALLNCRIEGMDNLKPDLLVVDRNLKLKKNLKLLKLSKHRKTYIFTSSLNKKKINFFKSKKCKIIKINELKTKNDFQNFLKIIYRLGKRRILVESGLIFLNKLLNYKLVNDLFIFKTKKKLRNKGYNNTKSQYLKKYRLINSIKVNLNEDKLFKVKAFNV